MNRKGFTLIELLIVIVIIGILAAIAIPKFGETRERAYVSAMQSDMGQARTSMEMCYQDGAGAGAFTYDGCGAIVLGNTPANQSGFTAGVTLAFPAESNNDYTLTAAHSATEWTCSYVHSEGIIDCVAGT
jgi:type IV pilus assembly protein PilA